MKIFTAIMLSLVAIFLTIHLVCDILFILGFFSLITVMLIIPSWMIAALLFLLWAPFGLYFASRE